MIDDNIIDVVSKWDLKMWEAILAFSAAAIPALLGILKIRKVMNNLVVSPLKTKLNKYLIGREHKRLLRLFEELEPMIELHMQTHVKVTLEQYNIALRDHQITLKSSIAESVEFKTFVNDSILGVQSSIEEMMIIIKQNSADARMIIARLSDPERGGEIKGELRE